ncbi:MAG: hypothetical protein ACLFTT_08995 [Candidatus Hydrogenedentota bacterium]
MNTSNGIAFSWLPRLVRGLRKTRTEHSGGLLPADAFEECLRKERARVDRGGPPFSVLALRIDARPGSKSFLQAVAILAALLNERTRFIDTKGWYGDRIGVILPNTPADRVRHIWPPLKAAFDKRLQSESLEEIQLPEVHSEVYIYPCDDESRRLQETP